ncbi:hypothetical protein BABINDRAFT_161077 [Babjeviella inositovora NRRL Y-12698]|uniref:PNPLA domain-containing protein n=1 Tax=Babjeviella inositovora NRRL Y-12698 TaxID=984486 RepID=A0A1E3QTB3_9ASCO|nr:uncharacterized protein BABINDRAFT_161077 [Babjeviella inositovora NRRL Y-12698]ODQ80888.1 hypothetical protein BABINDRAFT_161077 [Babjeviella inositovora NRRL Y-12698]
MLTSSLFLFIETAINCVPGFLWPIIYFVLDIVSFHSRKIYNYANINRSPLKVAKTKLYDIDNFGDWERTVATIDRLSGAYSWRQNYTSSKYDYNLISERIKLLQQSRESNDFLRIISLLRSSLIRNFGGISSKELFTKSYAGTKTLIEDYITEVLTCLTYLNDLGSSSSRTKQSHDMNASTLRQIKLDFFHDTRQSFGSTALILQGGSLFGLCHLGVVKALYFKGLLPRIISGNAIGGAVAALVCTQTDQELIPMLVNLTACMREIDRLNTDVDERYASVIENIIKKGYSQDILVFLKFVRDSIGDITFEESYLKTEKVLNITISPSHTSVPSLLNYVTTPNVVIWSAIYASIGTGVLSDNVSLYVKNPENDIVPFDSHLEDIIYNPPSFSTNAQINDPSPYTRLTELFNVNHFVISLARPYLSPLIGNDIRPTLSSSKLITTAQSLVSIEFQYRFSMLNELGRLPAFFKRFAVDEKTPRTNAGEITIVPELRYYVKDFTRLFDVHNCFNNIPYWIKVGEKSTWGVFGLLWVRCAVEFALDDLYNLNRKRRVNSSGIYQTRSS